MSTPPTTTSGSTGTFDYANKKAFYDTYIDHRKAIIVIACVLLFFGLIIYLQICAAECSNFDPSGLVGSSVGCSNGADDDTNTLNGTSTGCLFSMSILLVLFGAGILMYYYCLVKQSHKLIDADLPMGASIINMNKKKPSDVNLLAFQAAVLEQQCVNAGIDPSSLITNPLTPQPSAPPASP